MLQIRLLKLRVGKSSHCQGISTWCGSTDGVRISLTKTTPSMGLLHVLMPRQQCCCKLSILKVFFLTAKIEKRSVPSEVRTHHLLVSSSRAGWGVVLIVPWYIGKDIHSASVLSLWSLWVLSAVDFTLTKAVIYIPLCKPTAVQKIITLF